MRSYNRKVLSVFIFIIFNLSTTTLFSQEASIAILKNEFNQMDSTLTRLNSLRAELSQQAQNYVIEIQKLKEREKLNFFQQKKLEALLKDSQDLTRRIEAIDSEQHSTQRLLKESGQKLLDKYDSEIKKRLKLLEDKTQTEDFRVELIKEIENMRVEKEQVQQKIGVGQLRLISLSKVELKASDSPAQIKQKADLLKDQEDKLRRLQKQIKLRTTELQKELTLQNRMNDLVLDIALFDQQEEALVDVNALNQEAEEVANVDVSEGVFRDKNDLTQNLLVGQKDFDFSNLSPEQLEEVIANLKKKEQRAKVQADSLAHQAEVFYRTAKKMKKQ